MACNGSILFLNLTTYLKSLTFTANYAILSGRYKNFKKAKENIVLPEFFGDF